MKSPWGTLLTAVVLGLAIGSLGMTERTDAEAPSLPACCVCTDCGHSYATTSGRAMEAAQCIASPAFDTCASICGNVGCGNATFENATCSSPGLAIACGEDSVMAPAASSLGLLVLAAALSGAGAFFLRRRSHLE